MALIGQIIALVWTIRQTRNAVTASQRSAKAAEDAVSKSDELLSHAQGAVAIELRAYVCNSGFQPGISRQRREGELQVDAILFFVDWRNAGKTNALEFWSFSGLQLVAKGAPAQNFVMLDNGERADLGPGVSMRQQITIAIDQVTAAWRGERDIYIWSVANYRDVFEPNLERRSELCARLICIHDPRGAPPDGHPFYVQAELAGPNHST